MMSCRNRVFFGKLPHETRRRDIEHWLEDYGFRKIENIQLKPGYAFVDFRDQRDAEDCVRDLDRREFLGNRSNYPRSHDSHSDRYQSRTRSDYRNGYFRDKYGPPYNTEWKIIVSNLSTRVGWQEMKDFFRQAGNVTYAECHRNRSGEGAVEFSCREDLRKALEKLDGVELMGRRVKLTEISQRSESRRSPSLSGDRGTRRRRSIPRSYSRDRSRSASYA